jgi:hypothetical protein
LNLLQYLLPLVICALLSLFYKGTHEKLLHLFLFLLFFFPGLMFFVSGFGKSQLWDSVSNLGLSFSFLISFFCNRTWRCWKFYNRTQKMLRMGDCLFFWVYGHVRFMVHNFATLFQLLLITLSLCVFANRIHQKLLHLGYCDPKWKIKQEK